ncbi:hypothetical protein Mapa_011252 [Marchantia paleacea]|nr:hypothetical protein Mapa_011252 [Marchantia paleacea]
MAAARSISSGRTRPSVRPPTRPRGPRASSSAAFPGHWRLHPSLPALCSGTAAAAEEEEKEEEAQTHSTRGAALRASRSCCSSRCGICCFRGSARRYNQRLRPFLGCIALFVDTLPPAAEQGEAGRVEAQQGTGCRDGEREEDTIPAAFDCSALHCGVVD